MKSKLQRQKKRKRLTRMKKIMMRRKAPAVIKRIQSQMEELSGRSSFFIRITTQSPKDF
jgi:hypothetical protein